MRDYEHFPDDENGEVLWRMHEDGDDLSKRRQVDFALVFPSEEAALDFAKHLLRHGKKVSFGPYDDEEFPWQVEVHPIMVPTHPGITAFEAQLASDAEPFGGHNDGWGCFSV